MDQEVIDKVKDKKITLEKELVDEIDSKVSELHEKEQELKTSIKLLENEENALKQQKNTQKEQIKLDLENYKQEKQTKIDDALSFYRTSTLNELEKEFSNSREELEKEQEELNNSVNEL